MGILDRAESDKVLWKEGAEKDLIFSIGSIIKQLLAIVSNTEGSTACIVLYNYCSVY